MTQYFKIPYPATASGRKAWNSQYGLNKYYAGAHWSVRRRDAEFWHMLTVSAMNKSGCGRTPMTRPVVITFYWNDNLDLDNHAVMGKMIVDAMKGRILTEDSRKFVRGIRHFFHTENYILVTVDEI